MSVQPAIVSAGMANVLTNIRSLANDRGVDTVAYIEEMFSTRHDDANRSYLPSMTLQKPKRWELPFGADKKIVDKITKGARMQG